MKRTKQNESRKITLSTTTVRALQTQELADVRGGSPTTIWYSQYFRCSWENCL